MEFREHQRQATAIGKRIRATAEPGKTIFAWVVPGGGKSWLPGIIARELQDDVRIAWFVPRRLLKSQAAKGMAEDFKLDIRETVTERDPARDTRGFVATHDALTSDPETWRDALTVGRWLVVIDEVHHAKVSRSGKQNNLAKAVDMLPYYVRLGDVVARWQCKNRATHSGYDDEGITTLCHPGFRFTEHIV